MSDDIKQRLRGVQSIRRDSTPLSVAVALCSEAADEIERLEAELRSAEARVAELEQWQRDMVEKAADKSLAGYRELGARAAAAENALDAARAEAEANRKDAERLRKELELCRQSK